MNFVETKQLQFCPYTPKSDVEMEDGNKLVCNNLMKQKCKGTSLVWCCLKCGHCIPSTNVIIKELIREDLV